jgi:8-oxo-dGTP diphosphatase
VSIRVQVSCIAIRDGKIALIKNVKSPAYATYMKLIPPGGHVELMETLEAACAREMREETGLIVGAFEMKGCVSFLNESNGYHSVCFFLLAHQVEGELVVCEPEKAIPQWVELSEVATDERIPEYHREFLTHMLSEPTFLNGRVYFEGTHPVRWEMVKKPE